MRSGQESRDELVLDRKRAELGELRARRSRAQATLAALLEEIASFERRYAETIGRRLAELEQLEKEIRRLGGYSARDSWWDELTEEVIGSGCQKGAEDDIKALYREVAKAVHPDLAASDGNAARHDLMSRANRAYAEEDRRALEEILRFWEQSVAAQQERGGASEMARLLREIAAERRELGRIDAEVAQLQESFVCRLKLRIDADPQRGSDLFSDLVEAVDLNIGRARKKLVTLRGSTGKGTPSYSGRCREIIFPESSLGLLYLREKGSANFTRWERFAPAQGVVQVPVEAALRLDVTEGRLPGVEGLRDLKPGDLQSLFLYQARDRDVEAVVHLKGIEELYLAGRDVTDAALRLLSGVAELKRIYLYQTAVTDWGLVYLQRLPNLEGVTSSGNSFSEEALALFQKVRPKVKTVTFPWRH